MAKSTGDEKATIVTTGGTAFGMGQVPAFEQPTRLETAPFGGAGGAGGDGSATRVGLSPFAGGQSPRQGWDAPRADGTVVMYNPAVQLATVAWLYCWKGLRKGSVKQLTQPRNEFGRDPSCQVELEDSYASDHHGVLILREEQWYIIDFASTNGTFVNDKPLGVEVMMPLALQDDDIIRIGESEYIFKKITKRRDGSA